MTLRLTRRNAIKTLGGLAACGALHTKAQSAAAAEMKPEWKTAIDKGLKWMTGFQSRMGHWVASSGNYPTAMTALAGTALISSGSTTTQGPYAFNIRQAVQYLITKFDSNGNGLFGDPLRDNRYTYGHGFSMLFLSQVLGEEEDFDRREELIDKLAQAVKFSVAAQTPAGGWGYVSAKDGSNFDEGSTTITQVQGLRGCRNAGIIVPAKSIEDAKKYIYACKNKDGGISYSSRNRGTSRPAITAAALAALYNAGDYDSTHVPEMLAYSKKHLHNITDGARAFGHWHYTYLYYSQVIYRQNRQEWVEFRDKLYDKIVADQQPDGRWKDQTIGDIYHTACNLIMLQLEHGYLPIYQR